MPGKWFGGSLLMKGIFDPILWSKNHYLAVAAYKAEPTDENRNRFYVAKQMAQLSLKVNDILFTKFI